MRTASDPDYGTIHFIRNLEKFVVSATTEADGSFALSGVSPSYQVSLSATHTDYGTGFGQIQVEGEEIRIADIKLPKAITIGGTVRYAETDEPASDVRVELRVHGETRGQTITNKSGHYLLRLADPLAESYMTLRATGSGSPPQWEGFTTLTGGLRAGENVQDVDIPLKESFASRQRVWLSRPGSALVGESKVAVLDNSDPAYNGRARYHDRVVVYDTSGKQQWEFDNLNTCETVGASHAIAWNVTDSSLWVTELVDDRLLKFDRGGAVVFVQEDVGAGALAIDPKSGNLWALTSEGTIYGKSLVVYRSDGELLDEWNIPGFDLAYSDFDDCFWVVGKKVSKVDRNGEIVHESETPFSWVAVSVDVQDSDGSAWVVERQHSQVNGSSARLHVFESTGEVRRKIDLQNSHPTCVAIDSRRRVAWVASGTGLLKLSFEGEILADVPVRSFSVCIEPDTGYVWVVGRENKIYRLDHQGRPVWSGKTVGESQKWLAIIP